MNCGVADGFDRSASRPRAGVASVIAARASSLSPDQREVLVPGDYFAEIDSARLE
jgi:hypothetical protein